MTRDFKVVHSVMVDSENEAKNWISEQNDLQGLNGYTVTKSTITRKEKKDKKTGDLIDEWYIAEVVKKFDIER